MVKKLKKFQYAQTEIQDPVDFYRRALDFCVRFGLEELNHRKLLWTHNIFLNIFVMGRNNKLEQIRFTREGFYG